MNRPLTHQQQTVYNLIRDRIISRGYGPTVREIGEHMNIRSPNGVMCHLRALERKGMILRSANKSRAIELTESISSLVGASLPVQGQISGGNVSLTSASQEKIDLALLASSGRCFVRVKDDSLIDLHIRNGDLVVVQKQAQAVAGDLALVRSAEMETNLCHVLPDGSRLRLQPVARPGGPAANDRAEILGVVVGVVRIYASHTVLR
jgi:repressor LexA